MNKAFETDVDLEIEGFELARGHRARKRLPAVELVDGTWVELPVEVVRGAKPGPVLPPLRKPLRRATACQ